MTHASNFSRLITELTSEQKQELLMAIVYITNPDTVKIPQSYAEYLKERVNKQQ